MDPEFDPEEIIPVPEPNSPLPDCERVHESERVPEKEPGSPNDPEETKFSSSICVPLPVISGAIFHSTGSLYSVESPEVSGSVEFPESATLSSGSTAPLPETTAPLPESTVPLPEVGTHISLLTV